MRPPTEITDTIRIIGLDNYNGLTYVAIVIRNDTTQTLFIKTHLIAEALHLEFPVSLDQALTYLPLDGEATMSGSNVQSFTITNYGPDNELLGNSEASAEEVRLFLYIVGLMI